MLLFLRFTSSHYKAKQALHALKLRAEYELFPASLQVMASVAANQSPTVLRVFASFPQVALALKRIAEEISPLYLPLDPEIHKKYSRKGAED